MKIYKLDAIVDGNSVNLKRNYFASRDDAIEYMFNYYKKHYLYNMAVEEEYPVNSDKHCIEYVCDYYNRFTVSRIAA